jgi:putative FmdB family regulatory protein
MPLYEYACRQCHHSFEQWVPTASAAPQECPKCHGRDLERLIGLPTAGRTPTEVATNCRGDGPPCGAPWCGRTNPALH